MVTRLGLRALPPTVGGASTEGLRDLIRQNVTIDAAMMNLLEPAAFTVGQEGGAKGHGGVAKAPGGWSL